MESLTEHNIFFDHHGLYDVTIRVPLIIWCPSMFSGHVRVSSLVQHVDLVPTILDILNIGERYGFDGERLVPLIRGERNCIRSLVYVEEAHTQRKRAIRTENFKYIYALSNREVVCRYCGFIHGGVKELYCLKEDPQELLNVVEKYPRVAQELEETLEKWVHLLISKVRKQTVGEKIRKIKGRIGLMHEERG